MKLSVKHKKILLWGVICFVLLHLFGSVGRSDYESALRDEAFYHEMVEAGVWPAKHQ